MYKRQIFRLSDTVTILRDGQLVQTLPTAQTDRAMLIRLMVGREITNDYPPRQTPVGEVLMEVKGLTNRRISDCSFSALCRKTGSPPPSGAASGDVYKRQVRVGQKLITGGIPARAELFNPWACKRLVRVADGRHLQLFRCV